MYAIYRSGRRYGNKTFQTYEGARSYARKLIRAGKFGIGACLDWNDVDYRNPSISLYDVKVVKV